MCMLIFVYISFQYRITGTLIVWGVYGVSYAVFDAQNNAAVCTFRVYNREVGCSASEGTANSIIDSTPGVHRCGDTCTGNQEWPGVVPLYLTCSMYGMWDEAVKTSTYIKPKCSIRNIDKNKTNRGYKAKGSSPTLLSGFQNSANRGFDARLYSTLTYQGTPVTGKEALQIATGDSQVFSYTSSSNQTVNPVITSLAITSTPACGSQAQISGNKCVTCGAGTAYDTTASTCVRCPIGMYKDSLVTSCTACHTSRTTGSNGATSSDYCKASCFTGQYYDELDLQGCRGCPIGFYQDVTGQFSCRPCNITYTTVGDSLLNTKQFTRR